MYGFATRAIHRRPFKKDVHGALRVPVYDCSSFEHDDSRSLQLSFAGKKPAHVYSRITNPTVEDFEQRLRELSGGLAALATSSGMAAISNTIMALAGSGTNIVTTKKIFGNTLALFEKTLQPWGLVTRCVSMSELDEIERAIDAKTCAVFLESMTNPHLEVADIGRISRLTHERGVPLVLDNTVMTPYLFNSKEAGADIEILSSTKSISGGGTVVGGVIIDNGTFDWLRSPKLAVKAESFGKMAFIAALRADVYRNIGACMSPHNAYLQTLGLETLSLRLDKTCANTQKIADFLENQPHIAAVHYPGLVSSPYHEIAARLFHGKYGGVLTFDLADQDSCFALMDSLQLIKRATNINDNKTLILHPASTIFVEYGEAEKTAMGLRSTMLRLSVGIEDYEDLLDDLQRGLKTL
ncbi:MAG: O-acetylhomoserine aminocarboxypropyltransferase/cysteine synthase [Deltaproteobacteria bacterium]|nr:O-acetylhomoserine aminocarboxypropyltransferase/cysteine synthase [Deltaproteobacteria bacterium]